jgi:F-type H+-transporting ATPase subunit gamma
MPAFESLQRQIKTAQELRSVVKTMKVLAAASIRAHERAVESLSEYSRTIEMGLQILLREHSDRQIFERWTMETEVTAKTKLGVIVFGSDQGMCGQFNEQIVRYYLSQPELVSVPSNNRITLAVGERVSYPLEEAGVAIATSLTMPSSLAGVAPMVQELLMYIETWRSQQQIERIMLLHHRLRSNTFCLPHTLQLLPIDRSWLQDLQQRNWSSRTLPTFTMDWERLFSALIRQHLFISVYRACTESLASENVSRLASMQVAQQNIEEQLTALHAQFQHQRQTSITEEILEIVSGSEALDRN